MSTRTNEPWLSDLRDSGLARELALEDLRAVIHKGLPFALSRWLSPDLPPFNALVEEVTQETLLRVLDQLDTFEGRSQFTTWVHKIAVRIALTELRRKRWRDSSLDELTENEDVPPPPGLLGVQDMPMEDAARKLKTNRNALYKLLHDARLRLRRRLSMEDISPHEVLTLFEQK